jgi:predicted transcriptional regulator
MTPEVLRALLEGRVKRLRDIERRCYRERTTVLRALAQLAQGVPLERVSRDLWDAGIRLPGIEIDTVTEL